MGVIHLCNNLKIICWWSIPLNKKIYALKSHEIVCSQFHVYDWPLCNTTQYMNTAQSGYRIRKAGKGNPSVYCDVFLLYNGLIRDSSINYSW